ncbi:MAG: electron transfer flavoprotein subunit alpha/FixB family protein [Clostridia bacterium]|nr:electron transfer flavoprotein subunit alpha/FixB family protein [Clostridia bacterium]
MNWKNQIWIVAEHREGILAAVSLEILGKACHLARQAGKTAVGVVLGKNVDGPAQELVNHGAHLVFQLETQDSPYYQEELAVHILARLAGDQRPEIILLPSSSLGQELAAGLAARLETGLASHCVDLAINEEGILEQFIPAYGGIGKISCPVKRPQMATIGPGVFPRPAPISDPQGLILRIPVQEEEPLRAKTLSLQLDPPRGKPLEEARAVVAGGAGIAGPGDWQLIEELALLLDGAVGATRPPVDEGWVKEELMIGQSGRTVQPDFYLGIGISGELQHTVGIERAKMIVSINNDPRAHIFDQSDYGIVADYREILPLLLAKIREKKKGLS